MAENDLMEIACAQVLQKESSVLSVQWTVLPPSAKMTPERLMERYLDDIRRFTLGVIRAVKTPEGIAFRLAGRVDLLRFRGPTEEPGGNLRLDICGGALAHREGCGRGKLSFGCEAVSGGTRVQVRLSDYCPLLLGPAPGPWRKALYRFTQAAIHRLVTVRFLVRLQRQAAGRRVCCRVVRIPGVEGETI